MKLVNIKEFEKKLGTNIDPYEIPGAMQALYDAMEDFDLVMCGECKYWDKDVNGHVNIEDHLCRRAMRWTLNTDYCSDSDREV